MVTELFLSCKNFLLFQEICLAVDNLSENDPLFGTATDKELKDGRHYCCRYTDVGKFTNLAKKLRF